MLDTKRSRGWFIVAVVAVWLSVGAFVASAGNQAMDEQRAGLFTAAEERLGGIGADEVVELVLDDTIDSSIGEPSELTDLLVIDGHEPHMVAYLRDGFEARYRIEAWGRSEVVVVRVDADGLDIVTE